ncbi:MAG: chorismate-binding protein [Nostoc sp.]|uniref:chorismate-binding protein n=1 Tax=Nostoc sp. TaxID=1180 RepID=UPI002FFA8E77
MWVWHTETKSVRCVFPLLNLEVVHIDGQLKVLVDGAFKELKNHSNTPKNLGELLIYLDNWIEDHNLTASGIIGSECRSLLDEKLHWITDSFLISEQIQGESLVFVMQAGNTEEFLAGEAHSRSVSQTRFANAACSLLPHNGISWETARVKCLTNDGLPQILIDNHIVEEVNKVVTHGLEIRQRLDIDHLVVSVNFPVSINADLHNSWLSSVKTHFPQGFLMKSKNWDLISCTPERFISITDAKLKVQILAGTFQKGTDFDKSSLMDEHQAARNTLRSIVEGVVGKLELTADCNLVEFDKITHFHSAFEKPHQSDTSMLWTLAHLTPSPATGTQDSHTQIAIQQLEGRTRGYYGGCFFLRTPGFLESLVSIRSIFKTEKSEVAEMIVGAGLKKGSTLSSESAEIISKATSSAKLLGVRLGK